MYLEKIKKDLKKASDILALCNTSQKNEALLKVASSISKDFDKILSANKKDVINAEKSGMKAGLTDRLKLNRKRLEQIVTGISTVVNLPDPIGKSNSMWTLKNGLEITKVSVPIGIIAIIYESRPNVTVDAFALALKSGNGIVLRGSSSAINSNRALEEAIKNGLKKSEIPEDVIHLVKDCDRNIVKEILTANDIIDLAIPRGGRSLIETVIKEASVPTLKTGEGNNHIYVDEDADVEMALNIIKNAKLQRVGVCNAVEKLLVHKNIANTLIPLLFEETKDSLEIHGDTFVNSIIPCKKLEKEELSDEYLDYILGIKIVENIDEAISHIKEYGTKHSECIITKDLNKTHLFQKNVDAAAVYVNASTRFTDGGEFGFGSEMGISTQKLHARGPIGLEHLISHKYLIWGNGQIRD